VERERESAEVEIINWNGKFLEYQMKKYNFSYFQLSLEKSI